MRARPGGRLHRTLHGSRRSEMNSFALRIPNGRQQLHGARRWMDKRSSRVAAPGSVRNDLRRWLRPERGRHGDDSREHGGGGEGGVWRVTGRLSSPRPLKDYKVRRGVAYSPRRSTLLRQLILCDPHEAHQSHPARGISARTRDTRSRHPIRRLIDSRRPSNRAERVGRVCRNRLGRTASSLLGDLAGDLEVGINLSPLTPSTRPSPL
jgi:hypothetical protein